MVLIRVLPRAILCLLAVACVPRVPAPRLDQPMNVGVIASFSSVQDKAVAAAPESWQTRIAASLSARNLVAAPVEAAAWTGVFAERRSTATRLAWMAESETDAGLLLLIEAEPRYYSQLEGRYRWTVEVHASVASRAHPEQATTDSFEVPVFLEFHHEREAEALAAAAPVIQRQVEGLIDGFIGGYIGGSLGGTGTEKP